MDGYSMNPTGISQPPPVERVPPAREATKPKPVVRDGRREHGGRKDSQDNDSDAGGGQEKTPDKDQGKLLDIVV